MINVAIVGYGYWGKNLVRNFNNLPTCNLKVVCESNTDRHAAFKSSYPTVGLVTDYNQIISDESIEAVVLATPVDSHYQLAKLALEAGKHVLVEKPMTSSYAEAAELLSLAEDQGKLLMVDHTFLYTGAVKYLKVLADSGTIGKINYIDSTRINLGLFQHDVNVLWDLAPHDISICHYLMDQRPVSVQATGISHTFNGIENIAYLTLKFEDNTIAHFNCSWISPVKIRSMLIGGDKKMVVFNDMEPSEKIKIYDTSFSVENDDHKNRIIADYRVGDIHVPKIDPTEALSLMAQDFIESIKNGTQPISNARLGRDVVEILDAAQQSISQNGKEILLDAVTV